MDWLSKAGYATTYSPDIEPEGARSARASFNEVIRVGRLRTALGRINTHIPSTNREGATKEAIRGPGIMGARLGSVWAYGNHYDLPPLTILVVSKDTSKPGGGNGQVKSEIY